MTRCTKVFKFDTSRENFIKNENYVNHMSIILNIEKVEQAMNKDDTHFFSIFFPRFLTVSINKICLNPHGILCKKKKWPTHLGWFISSEWVVENFKYDMNTHNDLELTYGIAWSRHLHQIGNMRISYSTTELLLFDDDIKGVFRHWKYNPDVASAFAYTFINRLYFTLGETFGFTTSPSNFEYLTRVRIHLSQRLSNNSKTQNNNKQS